MKLCLLILVLILTAVSASPQTPPKKSTQPKNPQSTPNEWTLRGQLMANPHNREAHQALCSILRKRGEYRTLAKERKAWLEDNPSDSSNLIELTTETEMWLHDPEYAISAIRRFLENLDPKDDLYGWANNYLGRQLISRRDDSEAIPFLKAATEANPSFPDYWAALGNTLVRAGQIDAGIAALRKSLELEPSSSQVHVSLGNALAAKGNSEDQETEYKAACSLIKNDPYLPKGYPNLSLADQLTKLARIQIKHGKLREAAESLDSALQIDPKHVYAYLLRARLFELESLAPEAAAQRKKAESIVADENRGKGKQSSKSFSVPLLLFVMDDEDEIIRILTAQTDLPVFDREILALAYWETGQREKAINTLKALKNPELSDAFDYFSLAQALKTVGLNEEAKENYRKAYEMDPENTTYRYEYEAIHKSGTS